jgi:hypothetical protein
LQSIIFNMSCLSSLPHEVLKLVMHHLDLQDRLGNCCLVSKGLHAAAVAATDCLALKDLPPQETASVLSWLTNNGHHLTRLYINTFPQPLQQLPCPNLRELQLLQCSVQLAPTADGSPGVIQGCTKLTRLELQCHMLDVVEGRAYDGSLSSLVHLQHLHVGSNSFLGLSVTTLPRLQHLTYLYVNRLSIDNLLQLSGLTSLQKLSLNADDEITIGPSSVPGLAFPASLSRLGLWSPVEPGI